MSEEKQARQPAEKNGGETAEPSASDTASDDGSSEAADRSRCRCGLLLPIAGGVGIVLLLLSQTGVFSSGKVEPGSKPIFPEATSVPPDAGQVAVAAEPVPVIYQAVGTIQSRNRVDVTPRIVARIVDIIPRDGDRVEKGDVLIRLDDAELQAAVSQAQQGLEAARAALSAAVEGVRNAQAGVELAENERRRMRQAAESRAVSQSALDQAETAYRQAASRLEQARQNELAARAQAAAVDQALNQTKAKLSYATIHSPMTGVVTNRAADPGDLASPGRVLLSLFDPETLWLEAPVRESLLPDIKLGDRLSFQVTSIGRQFDGDVREIVPSIDPGSRTFVVKVCLGPAPSLRPGMFGILDIPLDTETAILVPSVAVHAAGQLEYVETVTDEGNLQRNLVRTVPFDDSRRRVISGLSPGMTVVVPPE